MPKLTIGTTHFDDYTGLWATLQSLRLYHADVLPDFELLVIDNHPDSPHGTAARDLIQSWIGEARWVAAPDAIGTAPAKELVFREATGDAVLYLDCHVLVVPGAIKRLIEYYDQHPDTRDLLSGPLLYDNLTEVATHFADVWRGEMWGIWDVDERGKDPEAEPFPIPAMGMGLCSCRRDAWVGFNERFRGFGAEEFYIHEKFRHAGGNCLCLPFLRWVHRFGRPSGVPFPLQRWDKVRNYIIGHQELGIPMDRLREHFVDSGLFPVQEWDRLVADFDRDPPLHPCCGPAEETVAFRSAKVASSPEPAATLEDLFRRAADTPSDINEHCAKLRNLAADCKHVTEFGMRPAVSTVALLAGQPQRLVTYSDTPDPILSRLQDQSGRTQFSAKAGNSLNVEIDETDLLFVDTIHTDGHLSAELARHADQVRRWIVLHDTETYGEKGEDGGPGLLPALRRFMCANPQWSVVYHRQENHGLTVVSRDARDRHPLPSKIEMAKSLASSMVDYMVDGGKKAGTDTLRSRLEVCTLCPHRTENRCAVCGCFIMRKAQWRSSECPLGHWNRLTDVVDE